LNVLRAADFERSCAFDGQKAGSWSVQEKGIISMHFELKVKISILVCFLVDFPNILEHPSVKLFIKQQARSLTRRIKKSNRAMSGHMTRQVDHHLVILLMLQQSMRPEMRLPRAKQHEMLKDLFELVLFDPVFIVFMLDLNDFFVLGYCFCFYHLE